MGLFITFEGIEGCGKSTQAKLLVARLERAGRTCLLTREPGGTRIGREIRNILLNPAHRRMAPEVELALYFADRAQHLREVIWPALDEGQVVVSDRYTDSTIAYQGYGRRLPRRLLTALDRAMTGTFRPQATVLLDLNPEDGLRRALSRDTRERKTGREGRFEAEKLEFHRRVRRGYLKMARQEPERFVVVPARGKRQDVHERIWETLALKLHL